MSTELAPPTDWSSFEWKPSAADPALYTRETAAGETFEAYCHEFCYGEQFLFVATELALAHPVSSATFRARLLHAWLSVRFDVPTIAAQTVSDKRMEYRMEYRAAKDARDAQAWAARTVRLVEDIKDLDELRFALSTHPMPEANGDQSFLYFIPRSETGYAAILHTSHVPFDGSGAKIVLGRVLTKLAVYLADPALAESEVGALSWGTEVRNLAPACQFLVGPRDPLEGPLIDKTLDNIMTRIGTFAQHARGLKERQIGPGPTRRVGYVFSKEESARIFAACNKRHLPQHRFTVNQILQAALTLVTWLDNPPTSPTTHEVYSNFALTDGRARLAPQWRKAGKDGYAGYCLGVGVTEIPVDVVTAAMAHGEVHALLQVARIVRAEFAHAEAYIGVLTAAPRQVHLLLDGPKHGSMPPPSTSPWISGDGAERNLAPEYRDAAGAVAIEVLDILMALNKNDPAPFFRSWTWRGRLHLSADFNSYALPREDVEGMVAQWARILRLVLEEQ